MIPYHYSLNPRSSQHLIARSRPFVSAWCVMIFTALMVMAPSEASAAAIRQSPLNTEDSTQVDTVTASPSVGDDIMESGRSLGHLLTSPLRWDGNDLLTAGVFFGGLGGSALLDDEARDLVLRNRSRLNDALEPIGNGYATVLYMAPSALLLYISGAAFGSPWLRETGQMLIETSIAIGILQVPLSITLGRARPFLNEGNASFKLFAGKNDDRASFFSGHSMVSFGFSTILAHQIDNPWATVGLYTLAAMGPLARMYIDKHWLSDTFFGALMGVFVGNSIHSWHYPEEGGGSSFLLLPTLNGVSLTMRF